MIVLVCLVACALADCTPGNSPAAADTVPANAGITTASVLSTLGCSGTPASVDEAKRMCSKTVQPACSEVVKISTQGSTAPVNQRTNCPFLAAGLTAFETRFPTITAGQDITLTAGDKLLLSSCSLTVAVGRITIPSGAQLILNDQPLNIFVREIQVDAGGSFLAGSETCRLWSEVTVNFLGTAADSSPTVVGGTSKGVMSSGTLEVHGKQFHPTWTRLAVNAKTGDTIIFLQDPVNWEVGQQILFATSSFYDCPAQYGSLCAPCQDWELQQSSPKCNIPNYYLHQNEQRTITAIANAGTYSGFVLTIDSPLMYDHFSGSEYQSEVALLSRRIKFVGSQSGDNFGGHVMAQTATAVGKISGVQGENMGQLNVLGRYPFHLHLIGDNGVNSFIQDCSVTNSQFRAYVVHGTNNTRISRNVGYNVKGFAVYLEDGVEENNRIEYNFMAHVHPIKSAANGGFGQLGQTFAQAADLLVPADTSASGYYISNAYNDVIGNAASGGWSGFAFPNIPKPLGNFRGLDWGNNNPQNRPTKSFAFNTAHSTGFYWQGHGSAIYCGASLTQSTTNPFPMSYNSGRNARNSKFSNGTTAVMEFFDTKVWAVNKGIAHWGNTIELTRYECHDHGQAFAMLFGEAAISDAVVNARTTNVEANKWQQIGKGLGFVSFQFYDTSVKTILSRVTFRNAATIASAVRYMDHSDHYTPQGINSVSGLRFENVTRPNIVGIRNCGPIDCPQDGVVVTHSSRIYSVWDFDGTLAYALTGSNNGPAIVGSNQAWWKGGDDCAKDPDYKLWRCPWRGNRNIVFIMIEIPGLSETNVGCSNLIAANCTDQYSPYTVGYVTQFGSTRENGIAVPPWPAISGLSGTGWFYRTEVKYLTTNIEGSPRTWKIGESFQLPRGEFVVVAMAYPAGTTFEVKLESAWNWIDNGQLVTYPAIPQTTKDVVFTPTEDLKAAADFTCPSEWYGFCTNVYKTAVAGLGPGAWFFDGTHFFIRVVSPGAYNKNQRFNAENNFYTNSDIRVPRMMYGFRYVITATPPGTAQSTTFNGNDYFTVPETIPAAFPVQVGSAMPTPAPSRSSQQSCTRGSFLNGGVPSASDAVSIAPIAAFVALMVLILA